MYQVVDEAKRHSFGFRSTKERAEALRDSTLDALSGFGVRDLIVVEVDDEEDATKSSARFGRRI